MNITPNFLQKTALSMFDTLKANPFMDCKSTDDYIRYTKKNKAASLKLASRKGHTMAVLMLAEKNPGSLILVNTETNKKYLLDMLKQTGMNAPVEIKSVSDTDALSLKDYPAVLIDDARGVQPHFIDKVYKAFHNQGKTIFFLLN